jgi:hypothetical protein
VRKASVPAEIRPQNLPSVTAALSHVSCAQVRGLVRSGPVRSLDSVGITGNLTGKLKADTWLTHSRDAQQFVEPEMYSSI